MRYYPVGDESQSITVPVSGYQSSVKLDDLSPGKEYVIEITPISPESKPGNKAITAIVTREFLCSVYMYILCNACYFIALDNPSNIETIVNENNVELTWKKPVGKVTHFKVKATPINKPYDTVTHEVDGSDQSLTINS